MKMYLLCSFITLTTPIRLTLTYIITKYYVLVWLQCTCYCSLQLMHTFWTSTRVSEPSRTLRTLRKLYTCRLGWSIRCLFRELPLQLPRYPSICSGTLPNNFAQTLILNDQQLSITSELLHGREINYREWCKSLEILITWRSIEFEPRYRLRPLGLK